MLSLKRSLLLLAVVIPLAASALGTTAYVLLQHYQNALKKEQISSQIAAEVFQRRLVGGDYQIFPTQRAKVQWFIEQNKVERLVNDNFEAFNSDVERQYIQKIKDDSKTSRENFSELIRISESGPSSNVDKTLAISSLLSFSAQAAITDATKLQKVSHNQAKVSFNQLTLLLSFASLMFLAFLALGFGYVWRSATELERLDLAKDEFVSLASHQLRTPLTSIMLSAHMLNDGYVGKLSAQQKEMLDDLIFSTDRMTELVTVLLNIARMEAGRVRIKSAPTDVHKILGQIINEQKPRADEKEIKLVDETKTHIPLISTDQRLVKELFANLISNAIKYTPPKGMITARMKIKDGFMCATVRDSGYGIPRAEQGKVFVKFYRGANIVKKEVGGTGLGLYLFKLIAESLGGKVGFTSVENEGSEFWFTLPMAGSSDRQGNTEIEETKTAT